MKWMSKKRRKERKREEKKCSVLFQIKKRRVQNPWPRPKALLANHLHTSSAPWVKQAGILQITRVLPSAEKPRRKESWFHMSNSLMRLEEQPTTRCITSPHMVIPTVFAQTAPITRLSSCGRAWDRTAEETGRLAVPSSLDIHGQVCMGTSTYTEARWRGKTVCAKFLCFEDLG